MFDDWKRRRAARRVKPGDGRPLPPFHGWQLLTGRKLFYLRLPREDGRETVYAVDIRLSGKQADENGNGKAHLYRDGRHHAESVLPAVLPVEGGTIEVETSTFGLKRSHYVPTEGQERRLEPDPRSAVGRRLRLEHTHPSLSRSIGAVSIVVLILGVSTTLLQIVEPILQVPPLVERFGRFESPVQLPLWLTITLGAGAVLASMERALRLRYRWFDALAS